MPGLVANARIFTKTMTAAIWFLREVIGGLVIVYINDLLIQDRDERTCRLQVEIVSILVLQDLGYSINSGKSALPPSRVVGYLGFVWNSD